MIDYIDYKTGRKLKNGINVSSKGQFPFSLFSPFSQEFSVPHPCDNSIICPSVEALWQGSKCMIEIGIPDYAILKGHKRWAKGIIPKYGIWLGKKESTTDIGLGRRLVYIPAYLDFCNKILKEHQKIIPQLKTMAKNKEIYYLYDYDYNLNYDNKSPLSHARILKDYLNLLFN